MTKHLGSGLAFPFTFSSLTGGAVISSGQDHVHDSIRQILGTRLGERLRRPDFGSRLHELVFEQNERVLHALIREYIREALRRWEPRITITEIEINDSPNDTAQGRLNVVIHYRVIESQVTGNLVYPFYRET